MPAMLKNPRQAAKNYHDLLEPWHCHLLYAQYIKAVLRHHRSALWPLPVCNSSQNQSHSSTTLSASAGNSSFFIELSAIVSALPWKEGGSNPSPGKLLATGEGLEVLIDCLLPSPQQLKTFLNLRTTLLELDEKEKAFVDELTRRLHLFIRLRQLLDKQWFIPASSSHHLPTRSLPTPTSVSAA